MTKDKARTCGLVMPISPIDGCSASHWEEVQSIVRESLSSIKEFEFEVSMVSDADDVGVIQKRIVENLYRSDIVICDVSAKNPNVMFELGMRLAFDKPTVIIKDETDYSFDTGIIEHIPYPRGLRFKQIVDFKERLASKVAATLKKSEKDGANHSTFLKNFGTFKVAELSEDVLPADQLVISMLKELQNEVSYVRRQANHQSQSARNTRTSTAELMEDINSAAQAWLSVEDCKTEDLVGNSRFFEFVNQEVPGMKAFHNGAARRRFINHVIAQMEEFES